MQFKSGKGVLNVTQGGEIKFLEQITVPII